MDTKSLEQKLSRYNLVEITDPHFIINMMYARKDNIAGLAVYQNIGLGHRAFVHKDVLARLAEIIPELETLNLKLKIHDAYRPPLAHTLLMENVPVKGLFADNYELSNHCHGTAIDVSLTDMEGNDLEFPTNIDAYTTEIYQELKKGNTAPLQENLIRARHDYMAASLSATKNREILRRIMTAHGFETIPHEWWHYNLKNFADYPVINTNCFSCA